MNALCAWTWARAFRFLSSCDWFWSVECWQNVLVSQEVQDHGPETEEQPSLSCSLLPHLPSLIWHISPLFSLFPLYIFTLLSVGFIDRWYWYLWLAKNELRSFKWKVGILKKSDVLAGFLWIHHCLSLYLYIRWTASVKLPRTKHKVAQKWSKSVSIQIVYIVYSKDPIYELSRDTCWNTAL